MVVMVCRHDGWSLWSMVNGGQWSSSWLVIVAVVVVVGGEGGDLVAVVVVEIVVSIVSRGNVVING